MPGIASPIACRTRCACSTAATTPAWPSASPWASCAAPTGDLMRRADTALLAAKRMTSQIRVHSPELDLATLEPPRRAAGRTTSPSRWRPRSTPRTATATTTAAPWPTSRPTSARWSACRCEQVERVRTAGLLHDVGYLDVDDAIFAKDEPPTDAEWDEIASHAERGRPHPGALRLRRDRRRGSATTTSASTAAAIPTGCAGDAIPLESRILHVADAYEAMTRGRSYQTAHDGRGGARRARAPGRHAVRRRAASPRCGATTAAAQAA